jgi:methyltransferase (TIGR00027 family)
MNHLLAPTTPCPSPSALRVATARALHQLLEPQRVLDDPFALGSLGPATAAALLLDPDAHNDVSARSLRAGIVVRSRFAEDRLLKAIAQGCRQYAVVGAGLDTWALRTAQTLPALHVLELDQPAMQAWKQRLYADNGWARPTHLHWVPTDLRETTVPEALRQGGIDLSAPTVVSILGVLVYLDPAAVERTIEALGALPIGSALTLDYRLDEQRLHPMERTMMQFTAQLMAADGEPWQSSSTPEQMKALLAVAGYEVEEDLGPAELNARYLARRRDGLQIAGGGFRYLSAVKVR